MDLLEIDEELYEDIECGILMVSDEFGVELFKYDGEAERNEGAVRLSDKIAEMDDGMERDLVFVENGELEKFGSWNGSQWDFLELPALASAI